MIVCLEVESPFIIGSKYNSILLLSGSATSLPRSCCTRCQTKSLGGLRRTNKPNTRTPCRALTRSKVDQSKEFPWTNQDINSIVQFRPIRKNTIRQTNVVLIKRRRNLRSTRSDSWFLARRRKSRSFWYFVSLINVRAKRITFPRSSSPIGT